MRLSPPLVAVVVAIVVAHALHFLDYARGVTSELTDREKILRETTNNGIAFLVLCIGLLFCLPSTPSLSTFGHPGTAADVASPERVLKYLQDYNDAIVRLSDTLQWLLFTGVFWLGWNIISMLRRVKRTSVAHTISADSHGAA
jgi:hypothetical protein